MDLKDLGVSRKRMKFWNVREIFSDTKIFAFFTPNFQVFFENKLV